VRDVSHRGTLPGGVCYRSDPHQRPAAPAQPVQRATRLAGGGNRVEYAAQLRGDGPGTGRQQLAGAAAQAAPGAAAFLIELVLGPAVGAGVGDREPGAIRACAGGRPGRGDQPPLLAARRAWQRAVACASAIASWRSACPDGATASTAASSTGRGSDLSAAAAMSTT
jgi:hypothetical protein